MNSESLAEYVEGEIPESEIDLEEFMQMQSEVLSTIREGRGEYSFDDTEDGEENWDGAFPWAWEVQGPKGVAMIYGHMEALVAGRVPRFHMFTGQYKDDPSVNILEDAEAIRKAVADKIKTWIPTFMRA